MSESQPAGSALPDGFRLAPAEAGLWAAASQRAVAESWAGRLFDRDPSLWSSDPAVQAGIADRLGWLDAPEHFLEQVPLAEATLQRQLGIEDDGGWRTRGFWRAGCASASRCRRSGQTFHQGNRLVRVNGLGQVSG